MYEITMYNSYDHKFKIEAPAEEIKNLIPKATMNFRSVEILDSETGEVMFTHYVSSDWFESPDCSDNTALMLTLLFN